MCQAHLAVYNARHLPYGQHLNLNDDDITTLMNIVNRYFSIVQLAKMERFLDTNKSEAFHRRVTTYAPKCTTYSRNYEAQCHSAGMSHTYGTGRSTVMVAAALGVDMAPKDAMKQHMLERDRLATYHAARKRTPDYLRKRYMSKKHKINRRLRLAVGNQDRVVQGHHNYAINLF